MECLPSGMNACFLGGLEEPLSAWGSALLPSESAMVEEIVTE